MYLVSIRLRLIIEETIGIVTFSLGRKTLTALQAAPSNSEEGSPESEYQPESTQSPSSLAESVTESDDGLEKLPDPDTPGMMRKKVHASFL